MASPRQHVLGPPQDTAVGVMYRDALPWERFFFGGTACMAAALVTNPIDVCKVRMQLQGESRRYKGLIRGIPVIWREEGVRGLYRGLTAALLREASYSTLRMGLYDYIRHRFVQTQGKPEALWKKLLAGGFSGAVGSAIFNPFDLVKVRMQSYRPDGTLLYRNTWDALTSIVRTAGLRGLYQGTGPNVQRAMLLTGTQLPSYDHSKGIILRSGWMGEGIHLHLVCSMWAGLACALTTSPIDLVKSRFMNQQRNPDGSLSKYKNTLDCFVKTVRREGFLGLYQGFIPNWFRIGPHTITTFLVMEWLRRLANVKPI
ncbi:mitochondrial substrate carrier family protein [Gonapodya prolifera JEL478]|uniref:Mitochondrial substrate carrier family protein n=1 Tax=Gonapodya prolifera (strain JEL478) TaxID=1344416 RepID=A0A139ASV8_GONPJ|nr:mitochondrial substrate carrier family protein [Gonapodya prolifera JEL478]|eukprot:KXS19822.1 mitochondrial substrate carrier family protein [Gonapodya prolifera JEL478]